MTFREISIDKSFARNLTPNPIRISRVSSNFELRESIQPIEKTENGIEISQRKKPGLIYDENDPNEGLRVRVETDVGASLRLKRRNQLIKSTHDSLSRHTIPISHKIRYQDLFQKRLRLNHESGKYETVNWADPRIPAKGVGLQFERVMIPSLLLPKSVISELRVSNIEQGGAAELSRKIRVGDILLEVRIYEDYQ
jgi:hypothetical protein